MPKDIRIEVPTLVLNMGADAYHHYAKEYYDYYVDYPKPRPKFSPVPYTLLFHSIELELKSLLLKSGKKKSEVRKYNHKLIEAYDALCNADKILTLEEVDKLKKSTPILLKKDYEYFLPIASLSLKYMPDLSMLDNVARKLLNHNQSTI